VRVARTEETGSRNATSKVSQISIVPVNTIDSTFLSRLASCLEERFLYPVIVRASLHVPKAALNSVRKQLFLSSIIGRITHAYPVSEGLVLGVTDYDLYKTSHQFIFGGADETQRCAAVAIHRLRSEFYGEKGDENLLFQRTLKEAVHELGHALGLRHCFNARCAMYATNSIYDADNKQSHFCDACEKRSRANRPS
jgi:archaemetzincin